MQMETEDILHSQLITQNVEKMGDNMISNLSNQELGQEYDPEETEHYFREEIFQWIQLYLQEHPLTLSKASYYQEVTQTILDALYPLWKKEPFIQSHWKEEDIGQIIYEMVCQFCPKRYSLFSPTAPEDPLQSTETLQTWQQKVQMLQQLDEQNPKQGTTAWLKQRYNMITASDCYKALSTQTQLHNLVKAKSQPFHCYGTEDEEGQRQHFHGPAPMVWGHMFEPVSVQIYEHLTGEKVMFMGCIPHPQIPYLGASPDGVISPWEKDGGRCQRIQRLLEIKNPISREIDGIPSEAYWIQQQIQMEVCDMEGCDFFETTFKTIDDLSSLFPSFLPKSTTESVLKNETNPSSGLSSEMSEDNVNDHPPTQDTNTTTPHSLYYGVIVEYLYRNWGDSYPSIKRMYLPPLTVFTTTTPLYVEHGILSPRNSMDSDADSDADSETEGFPETPEEYENYPHAPDNTDADDADHNTETIHYEYVMDIKTQQIFDHPHTLQEHIENQIPKYHPDAPEYKLSKRMYWKLENASLVFVERNREWFEGAKPKLQEAWNRIQQAREQLSTAPLPTTPILPEEQLQDTKIILSHHPVSSTSSSYPKKGQKSLRDWFG